MGDFDSIDLGQFSGNLLALVEAVVQIQFPQQEEYYMPGRGKFSFSGGSVFHGVSC
jgi:hypothetical protein